MYKRIKFNSKTKTLGLKVPIHLYNDLKELFYNIVDNVKDFEDGSYIKNYMSLNLNRLLEIDLSEIELKKFNIILMELLNGLDTYGLDKLCLVLKQGAKWKLIGI